jgi:hypothetical protein
LRLDYIVLFYVDCQGPARGVGSRRESKVTSLGYSSDASLRQRGHDPGRA